MEKKPRTSGSTDAMCDYPGVIRARFLEEVIPEMCLSGGVGVCEEARRRGKINSERTVWEGAK